MKIKINKGKKGVAHVEMIISFVIFISFITFMMIVFKPFKTASVDTSTLDATESGIADYLSANFSVSSLILNSSFSTAGNCIYAYFPLPEKAVVKDENAGIVNANKSGGYLYLRYSSGKRFYRIYSSEELEEKNFDTAGCYRLNSSDYTIGVTREYKKISYSNLIKLNETYNNDYSNLKKNLSLVNDFTFVARDDSGVIFEGKKNKPQGVNIIAKDIPIEILDKNAGLNPAILNIQVWE